MAARAQVFGVVWNNWVKDRDGEGREYIAPSMFVTYGVKHLKFWTQEFNEVGRGSRRCGSTVMAGSLIWAGTAS